MLDTAIAKAQLAQLESARAAIQRSWPSTVDRLRLHMIGAFKPMKQAGMSLETLKAAKAGFDYAAGSMADAIAAWEKGEREMAELREALRPVRDLTEAIRRKLETP